MDDLRLALFQHAPRLGDRQANIEKIARVARDAAADICLAPELSFTGYDVRDNAPSLALPLEIGKDNDAFKPLRHADGIVIAGMIEAADDGRVFNTAVAFDKGRPAYIHRKIYLPTYGMFDEMRYFARGNRLEVFETNGWRIGILVCEDFWHPGLVYALAAAGIDALFVIAAGSGRGAWDGGENGDFASMDTWERMARTSAQMYGIYVALANRVGVEGGVTFGGGSVIVSPSGEVLARGPSHDETVLTATLSRAQLHSARRPYFHGRDDDPALVIRELQRLALP